MHPISHVYTVTAIGAIEHDKHTVGTYATLRDAETIEARLRAWWCEAHRMLPAFDPVATISGDDHNERADRWQRGVRALDPPPEDAECLRDWLRLCEPSPDILVEAVPVRTAGEGE